MNKGIWNSKLLNNLIESKFQISLGEGDTSVTEKNGIWFKRDDLNPTGSVKDRGLAYQVSWLNSLGIKKAVISSSGNAAISAAHYASLAKIKLTAFLPVSADKDKIRILEKLGCNLEIESDSLKKAGKFAQVTDAYWIRPSINPEGHLGYISLGEELTYGNYNWLVFPISSGTTVAGVYQGMSAINQKIPKLLAVQTSSVNSISGEYDQDFEEEKTSIARGIITKNSPRKNQIHQLIRNSNGDGCVVNNYQIQNAYNELHGWCIKVSYDAAVAWAGWKKFREDENSNEKICIVLTGADRAT